MSTPLLPLNFIAYAEDSNLKEVNHNAQCLQRIAKEHGLRKHCDAVLLTNKAEDRFRVVAMFYSLPVLILPPVHPEHRLSLYLQVGQWLRKFVPHGSMRNYVDEQIKETKVRIERSEAAKAALAARERLAANG